MVKPDELIPVKFSEDTAQFAELRPVRRQPMTLHELVGLVLASTGKQPERVRRHLEQGTCTYNFYRYWWEGFALEPRALEAVLAEFPDPDPARPFDAERCLWMRFFDAQQPVPHQTVVERDQAAQRRWLRRKSFWDSLLAFVAAHPPTYHDYSYYHRADLYRAELAPREAVRLLEESAPLAPRELRQRLGRGAEWVGLELACRR